MKPIERPEVHAGETWVDRDKRMENRVVTVVSTSRNGLGPLDCHVNYRDSSGREFRSQYGRFQKRFQRRFTLKTEERPEEGKDV